MRIISVDPGEWCGVGFWIDGAFDSLEMSPFQAIETIERHGKLNAVDLVVGERYDPSAKKVLTQQLEAMYTLGALRYVTTRCKITFALQDRASAKKVTDATLRKLGWFRRTKDGHANDAARHICHALLTHDPERYLELLDRI
jgi:hypothetical protein